MTSVESEPSVGEGDLVVAVLASTLATLSDRLFADGHDQAAELVADLAEVADDYLARIPISTV